MKTIEQIYAERLDGKGHIYQNDILGLFPVIREWGAKVSHITEFGVRTGNSTCAFLAGLIDRGGGIYRGYDISPYALEGDWPKEIPGVDFKYIEADTAKLPEIEPTELLFIDSCHTRDHVLAEFMHHTKVSKYILMHDTADAWTAIGGGGPLQARGVFLATHPEWKLILDLQYSNGLSVLERQL